MKVSELIQALQTCDQEINVYVSVPGGNGTCHYDISTIEHWAEGTDYDHIHIYIGDLISG